VKTALVTRAQVDAAPLVAGLTALGLRPIVAPLLARRIRAAEVARAAAVGHDGWVLTSPAAVEALCATTDRPEWIAAVGPATAEAAARAGLRVDRVPERALGAGLAAELGDLRGQRVLYPKADLAPPELAAALRAAGAQVDEVVAYDNAEPPGAGAAIRAVWPVDVVCLLSGSAARRLAAHAPPPWPTGVLVAAIGPSTAAVAVEVGLPVHAVADPHTVGGLLVAVARLVRGDAA
jgi:uroporphyrinogen-III synthase